MTSDPADGGPDSDGAAPTTEELQAPSTEKDPGEEPKAEDVSEPEPSHEAVGIGVIDGPAPAPTASPPDV